mmetsp:Transcript_6451/g.20059  ORF Transcript_6451/g.20059 Transcript_6451/m.20059 type:complete len:383 (+) Transcript_6451:229-1377(+)
MPSTQLRPRASSAPGPGAPRIAKKRSLAPEPNQDLPLAGYFLAVVRSCLARFLTAARAGRSPSACWPAPSARWLDPSARWPSPCSLAPASCGAARSADGPWPPKTSPSPSLPIGGGAAGPWVRKFCSCGSCACEAAFCGRPPASASPFRSGLRLHRRIMAEATACMGVASASASAEEEEEGEASRELGRAGPGRDLRGPPAAPGCCSSFSDSVGDVEEEEEEEALEPSHVQQAASPLALPAPASGSRPSCRAASAGRRRRQAATVIVPAAAPHSRSSSFCGGSQGESQGSCGRPPSSRSWARGQDAAPREQGVPQPPNLCSMTSKLTLWRSTHGPGGPDSVSSVHSCSQTGLPLLLQCVGVVALLRLPSPSGPQLTATKRSR